MIKATDPEAAKAKAEALFKRQQLLDAAESNLKAVEAAKIAEAVKTARLRALRLAKEKSDRDAAQVRRRR